jgi:hypothetical protein
MKKKYLIGLIIIIIFAITGAVAFYYLKKQNQPVKNSDCDTSTSGTCTVDFKSATTVQTTKTQIGSFGNAQKIKQNIYSSDKLGFQMTFTDIWKDAKVVETIPAAQAEGKVEFKLPTKDALYQDGLATAMTIYVYKKGSAPTDNPLLSKITENATSEYYYLPWDKIPTDLGQFTEKEIAREASTLKLK